MCLILDADKYSEFLDQSNEDMQPVRNWINRQNGKIVYALTEKLETKLNKHQLMKKQILDYRRAGRAKMINKEVVNQAVRDLSDILSNDADIMALVIVSGVK